MGGDRCSQYSLEPEKDAAGSRILSTYGALRACGRVRNGMDSTAQLPSGAYLLEVTDARGLPIGRTRLLKQ